ncbi:hypothetical protein P148_SR1C00001G0311 [candidate division SR1 bacterium RAAC1_SR1_1]|nr:hypothetical protein P148_SR1C00001G0311 [candidate division SR1 bacterium RAAC1_SR1_1]
MNQAEQEQILTIVKNLEEQKQCIPFLSDLQKHPVFGPIFTGIDKAKEDEINQIIDTYIRERVAGLSKTKGGQLFQRFFETQEELFWAFRDINENPDEDFDLFQKLGKQVEQQMFTLEGILTEKMVGQEKGLDKVVSSFYNIIYSFFPRMGQVE